LRCPACYMIQDYTLRDFRCTLTRCPRVFVNIQPSNKSQSSSDKPRMKGRHAAALAVMGWYLMVLSPPCTAGCSPRSVDVKAARTYAASENGEATGAQGGDDSQLRDEIAPRKGQPVDRELQSKGARAIDPKVTGHIRVRRRLQGESEFHIEMFNGAYQLS
jgi:hypothetical protein